MLDKNPKVWYNCRPADVRPSRNFHYTTITAICQEKNRKNINKNFIPNLCNFVLDKLRYPCYTIVTKNEGEIKNV